MSPKEQRKKLWWELTRSEGKTRYLWRHALGGFIQGVSMYLIMQGLGATFGSRFATAHDSGVSALIVWSVIYTLVSWIVSLVVWERNEQRYPPDSEAPDNASRRSSVYDGRAGV